MGKFNWSSLKPELVHLSGKLAQQMRLKFDKCPKPGDGDRNAKTKKKNVLETEIGYLAVRWCSLRSNSVSPLK